MQICYCRSSPCAGCNPTAACRCSPSLRLTVCPCTERREGSGLALPPKNRRGTVRASAQPVQWGSALWLPGLCQAEGASPGCPVLTTPPALAQFSFHRGAVCSAACPQATKAPGSADCRQRWQQETTRPTLTYDCVYLTAEPFPSRKPYLVSITSFVLPVSSKADFSSTATYLHTVGRKTQVGYCRALMGSATEHLVTGQQQKQAPGVGHTRATVSRTQTPQPFKEITGNGSTDSTGDPLNQERLNQCFDASAFTQPAAMAQLGR